MYGLDADSDPILRGLGNGVRAVEIMVYPEPVAGCHSGFADDRNAARHSRVFVQRT